MPLFVAEIGKQQNWKALPPPAANLLVSLRKLDATLLVLHPFGALAVTQRAIPLELTLDKLGNQKPDDVSRLDITGRDERRHGTAARHAVDEQFAIAQFQAHDRRREAVAPVVPADEGRRDRRHRRDDA